MAKRIPLRVRTVQAPQEPVLLLVFDGSPPYPHPWPIKVYNIGKPGSVGVQYPDAWQEHSISWWAKRLQAAGHTLPLPPLGDYVPGPADKVHMTKADIAEVFKVPLVEPAKPKLPIRGKK